jgi:hypothetical protein
VTTVCSLRGTGALYRACGVPRQRGEFASLLWQASAWNIPRDDHTAPYALLLAGAHAGAVAAWREPGYPYEDACAWPRAMIPLWSTAGLLPFLGNRGVVRQPLGH